MKLFQRMLVAPAALGLLAPISANANEVNLNEISNYSDRQTIEFSNFVNTDGQPESLLIAGGEGLVDAPADTFSSTTSASFGSNFYVGSIDESPDDGAVTFSYDFSLGLSTSFTGEDSLDVAIIGGNGAATAVHGVMGGDSTGDHLDLDGVSYTFPLGGFTVIAGDGVGVDDLNSGACAYSAFTDTAGDCGTPSIGGAADSAVAASYDFGNGFTAAGGVGFDSESTGILNDEDASTIGLEVAYAADTYAVSLAYTDDDEVAGDTTYYSLQASYTPDAPYSISAGYEKDDDEATSYLLGLTTEVGPGSLSVGYGTQSLADDHDDNMFYEVAYAYDVNDGMTITPGMFVAETPGDDAFGLVVTTSFSF